MISFQDFLSRLERVKNGPGYCMARCPAHDDGTASLQVRDKGDRIGFNCFAGCSGESILRAMGLGWSDVLPARGKYEGPEAIDATYNYFTADRQFAYQVVRLRPKSFRQRHLKPGVKFEECNQDWDSPDWIKNIDGIEPILFGLPDLMESVRSGGEIWICEGEKDALRLREFGVMATCNSGGAGKWRASYTEVLKGAERVVIVRDRDLPGGEHSKRVYTQLSKVTRYVEVVEAANGKDAYDHLASGLDLEDFLSVDPFDLSGLAKDLPTIETANRELRDVTADAYRAIIKGNEPEPKIFSLGGALARVTRDAEVGPVIVPLLGELRRGVLARSANWIRSKRSAPKRTGERWSVRRETVYPPKDIAEDLGSLAPFAELPKLVGVARCPVLAQSFDLCLKSGYAAAPQLFLDLPGDIPLVDCSGPASAAWLMDELLCDFPFVDDASKAHALALMILPLVRPAINGPVPLFLVDAPTQGSGKSMLARCCLIPGLGGVSASNAPKDDEEWRKMITMQLVAGAQCIHLDNLSTELKTDVLCRALTEPRWIDRILGTSQGVDLPLRVIWTATSNNAKLSTDITRRTIYIRIDAMVERPDLRDGFKHENLPAWITANRLTILGHLTNMLRHWLLSPVTSTVRMGSFESFAEIVGGILESCGVDGFLTNQEVLRSSADDGRSQARAFLRLWWERFGPESRCTKDIRDMLADDDSDLLIDMFGDKSPGDQIRRLGYWLRANMDRPYKVVVPKGGDHGGDEGCDALIKVSKATTVQGARRFKLIIGGCDGGDGGDHSHPYVCADAGARGGAGVGQTSAPSQPVGSNDRVAIPQGSLEWEDVSDL